MPKVDLVDIRGKKSGKISLPEEIFAAKINPKLEALAARVYLANQRKAHPKTKTRGEVNRTKAKWYRQKGTGRARHGARSAPIFVGGGVAHGPRGNQNYQRAMNKKMRRLALFSALTSKLKEKNILVVDGLEKIKPKSSQMAKTLRQNLKIEGKVLIILPRKIENLARAARNIKGVDLAQPNLLNTYQILKSGKIILMKESIGRLKEAFLGK